MNLGDLKAQFKALLNNNIVNNNAALVTTFINQGTMRVQRELRVPFMEKQVVYTIPSDGSFTQIAIPNDLLELIEIMVDADGDGILEFPVMRVGMKEAAKASEYIGTPRVYARQGGSWLLGPPPAPGSQVLIYYYAEFTALASDTDTNTALLVAWDTILYSALTFACDFLADERAPLFEKRYTQSAEMLQTMADADELSADASVRPALHYGDY